MLDKKVSKLLNEQVNAEFYSAYLYLDFANYYTDESLDGFANWYTVQAQEERDHAMLFMKYMQNNGDKVTFDAIAKPDVQLKKYIDPLEAGAKHERFVTDLIHKIYDAAYTVKDFRTMQFLDWFVKEQGEEETNADNMVDQFKLFGNDPKGLFDLDRELAARAYTAPSLVL
ncbi:MAG: ferritin [Eubacteriaceae bacterium]|nr:ferritin [Eubacteriaceae bacterium]